MVNLSICSQEVEESDLTLLSHRLALPFHPLELLERLSEEERSSWRQLLAASPELLETRISSENEAQRLVHHIISYSCTRPLWQACRLHIYRTEVH